MNCSSLAHTQSKVIAKTMYEEIEKTKIDMVQLNRYIDYNNYLFNYLNSVKVKYYTVESMLEERQISQAFLTWLISKIEEERTQFDHYFGNSISMNSQIAFFNLLHAYSFRIPEFDHIWYCKPQINFTQDFYSLFIKKIFITKGSRHNRNAVSEIQKFTNFTNIVSVEKSELEEIPNLLGLKNKNIEKQIALIISVFDKMEYDCEYLISCSDK